MNIVLHFAAFFEWEPMSLEDIPKDADKLQAEIRAVRLKQDTQGTWLKKVIIPTPNHAPLSIPEVQIEDRIAHHERKGAKKSRASVVAWMIEELWLPHLGERDHLLRIQVEHEPEVEAYLNTALEVKKPSAATAEEAK